MGGEEYSGNMMRKDIYRVRERRARRSFIVSMKERYKKLGEAIKSTETGQRFSEWREERREKKFEKKKEKKKNKLRPEYEARKELDEEYEKKKKATEQESEQDKGLTIGSLDEIDRECRPILDAEIKTAIIRSQRRPPRTDPSQMDFADIIRDHRSLDAIMKGTVEIQTPAGKEVRVDIKTPAERTDSRYADEEMVKRRKELATRLKKGGLDDETFSSHELDIIYAAAIGQAGLWTDSTWPEDKPTPPEAFFRFLQNVAHKKYPAKKGEFIAHTLKDLCSTHTTIADYEVKTNHVLMDSQLGNEYIEKMSHIQFHIATSWFEMFAKDILTTPTSEFVESNELKLEVPGAGYEKITEEMISAKRAEMTEARGKADEARLREAQKTVENAKNAETAAKNQYDEVAEKVGKIKNGIKAGTLELSGEKEKEVEALERNAYEAMQRAIEVREVSEKIQRKTARTIELQRTIDALKYEVEKRLAKEANDRNYYERIMIIRGDTKDREKRKEYKEHEKRALMDLRDSEAERKETQRNLANRKEDLVRVEGELTELINRTESVLPVDKELREETEKAEELHGTLEREYGRIMEKKGELEGKLKTLGIVFSGNILECKNDSDFESLPDKMEWENPVVSMWLDEAKQLQEEGKNLPSLASPALIAVAEEAKQIVREREYLKELKKAGTDSAKQFYDEEKKQFDSRVTDFEKKVQQNEALSDANRASMAGIIKGLKVLVADKEGLERRTDKIVTEDGAKKFEEKIRAFESKVKEAPLPQEVKADIEKLADTLKVKNPEEQEHLLATQIKNIRETYASPMKKATRIVVNKLRAKKEQEIGEISDIDRIIMRSIWTATSQKVKGRSPEKMEGWYQKLKNWAVKLVTADYWRMKGLWLYRKTYKETVDDLRPSNWNRKITYRDKEGATHKIEWYKRWMRGVWKGALKGLATAGFIVAGWTVPQERGVVGHFWDHYVKRAPWLWVTPYRVNTPPELVVSDSPDIPERLAKRKDDFYRKNYGVGMPLPHETDDGAEERLDWLRDNPEVLRFFQERTSLIRLLKPDPIALGDGLVLAVEDRWEELDYALKGDRCNVVKLEQPKEEEKQEKKEEKAKKSKEGKTKDKKEGKEEETAEEEKEDVETQTVYARLDKPLPESCASLGLDSHEDVKAYQFVEETPGWKIVEDQWWRWFTGDKVERQAWETGGRVCCLIKLRKTEKIEDGLRLNPYESDRFTASLMKLSAEDVERQLGTGLTLTTNDLKALAVKDAEDIDIDELNSLIALPVRIMRESGKARGEAAEELLQTLANFEVSVRSVELLVETKIRLTQQDLTSLGAKEPQSVDLEKVNALLVMMEGNDEAHQRTTEELAEIWDDLKINGDNVEMLLREKVKLTQLDLVALGAEDAEGADLVAINALLSKKREAAGAYRSAVDKLNGILEDLERDITYDYLTRPDNMGRWKIRGFLVTEDEGKIINARKVTERKNVEFMVVNDAGVKPLFAPIAELGGSKDYLKEEYRNAFVAFWREGIAKMSNFNPSKENVPSDILESSFKTTVERIKAMGGMEDRTRDFEKENIRKGLRFIMDEVNDKSLDILYDVPEIRELVQKLVQHRSDYKVGKGSANALISMLYDHKREGGNISDFDPFGEPKGSLVDWAVTMKFLEHEGWNRPGRGAQVKDRGAVTEGESTENFFRKRQDLDDILAAVITGIGEKAENSEAGIREALKRLIESNDPRDVKRREGWKGIKVDEEGNATIANEDRAIKEIGFFVRNYLRTSSRKGR